MDTHPIRVSQGQGRSVNFLCLVKIRLVVGRLGSVKGNFSMGAVAEGFIFRLPATAQDILFLQGVCRNLVPGTAVSDRKSVV